MKLVVGTRGSTLALTQTQSVADLLRARHGDLDVTIRTIRTEGDIRADRPLAEIGGKGVFVKELEAALQRGNIDLAVHSLKDVPALVGEGLTLAAVLPRVDARDVLVSRDGNTLRQLRQGASVATGSQRREVQLRAIRPDLVVRPIRGNVDTRLRKLEEGQFDAIILAAAGLYRLGKIDRVTEFLEPELMLPSAGQGVLALETRASTPEHRLAAELDDPETRLVIVAERSFLARLGAGCEIPVAAHGRLEGQRLVVDGMLARPDGTLARSRVSGPASDGERLGRDLAEDLLERLQEVETR